MLVKEENLEMISFNFFNWLIRKWESKKVDWFAQSQMAKIIEASHLRVHSKPVINMKYPSELY